MLKLIQFLSALSAHPGQAGRRRLVGSGKGRCCTSDSGPVMAGPRSRLNRWIVFERFSCCHSSLSIIKSHYNTTIDSASQNHYRHTRLGQQDGYFIQDRGYIFGQRKGALSLSCSPSSTARCSYQFALPPPSSPSLALSHSSSQDLAYELDSRCYRRWIWIRQRYVKIHCRYHITPPFCVHAHHCNANKSILRNNTILHLRPRQRGGTRTEE